MHIPDGFLDPKMSAGMAAAAAAVLSVCFAKVKSMVVVMKRSEAFAAVGKGVSNITGKAKAVLSDKGQKLIYKMGMVASIVFAAQMFNFPVANGTSGHFIGGVFAAVILGPWAGTIVVSAVLLVQSLFFADGGLLSIGANIMVMAVAGAMLGYVIYYLLKKVVPEIIAIVVAAWSSVMLSALFCSLLIGLSGTVSIGSIMPAMLKVHAVIGIAEALITIALVEMIRRALPKES